MNPILSKKFWITGFVVTTIIGLLNFLRMITAGFWLVADIDYSTKFIEEMTGAYSFLILAPVIIWFVLRFRLDKQKGYQNIPIHGIFILIVASTHTFLMITSREILFPVFIGYQRKDTYSDNWLHELPIQIIVYCLFVTVIYFADYYQENKNQQIKTAKLETQLVNSKMEALRLQLNPHFLFNTLNMISSTMYEDIEKADRMLIRLSDLLRGVLNSSKQQVVSIKEELELFNHYISIMEVRFQEKLNIDIHVSDELMQAELPNFILQPLVENSIQNSKDSNNDFIKIKIVIEAKENDLCIGIEDNGPGIDDSQENLISKGRGISTNVKRLESLYSKGFSFTISNSDRGGADVKIRIPLNFKSPNPKPQG